MRRAPLSKGRAVSSLIRRAGGCPDSEGKATASKTRGPTGHGQETTRRRTQKHARVTQGPRPPRRGAGCPPRLSEQRARLHAARQEVGRLCTHPLPQLRVRLPPPRPLLRPRNRWPSPPRSGTRRGPALGEPGHRVAQHEVCHKASSSAGRNTARPHGARPPSFATPMLPWPRLPLPGPESRRL